MLKKSLKFLSAILLVIVISVTYIIHIDGNFYKVDDDVYRSGQLHSFNLKYYLEKYKFKTILNLRGASKDSWYTNEIALAKQYNVEYINHKISNRKFLDYNKTKQLVNIVRNAQKPLLIHCAGGADRTSLVVTLYQYAIKHKSKEIAKEQFSLKYGHSPYFRPKVMAMDRSFDNFVAKSNKELNEKD